MEVFANKKSFIILYNYFPKYLSNKCIIWYVAALLSVSFIFYDYALPFYIILFGLISVSVFFIYSSSLTKSWSNISAKKYTKQLVLYAFIIRIVYVTFIYFLNYALYDTYYESSEGDITWYVPTAEYLAQCFWDGDLTFKVLQSNLPTISDGGYVFYLMILDILTINMSTVYIPLILKALLGAYTCIFIYKIASRHFDEGTARMAGIFCMLQFNMIWWCGSMMKETEMVFLTCAAINCFDEIIYRGQFKIKDIIIGLLLGGSLFAFRTALGLCFFGAVFLTLMLTSNKIINVGKKITMGIIVASVMLIVGGHELLSTVEETVDTATSDHQQVNMEWRTERDNGNSLAKYAGAAVFAPLIFTIPFPSMVYTFQAQEMQMQVNGGNYIKNILSFFVIYAMFYLLFTKQWKKYVLIISFMCAYLLALVLSEFAQSGRFHMPILPFEMLFAAYGLSIISKRHLKWFNYALIFEYCCCIGWAWFKLAGRGLVQ